MHGDGRRGQQQPHAREQSCPISDELGSSDWGMAARELELELASRETRDDVSQTTGKPLCGHLRCESMAVYR